MVPSYTSLHLCSRGGGGDGDEVSPMSILRSSSQKRKWKQDESSVVIK
jgi:hypothetical protein